MGKSPKHGNADVLSEAQGHASPVLSSSNGPLSV